ncbi:hypothetical protein PLICRDRAFT_551601 [Plicaturopsis crispa FD-325 SS-3]|nr:hypothetical protein PLICRDRAFT_551601 [Plicaturopsis crispa FD-325 SS-3]
MLADNSLRPLWSLRTTWIPLTRGPANVSSYILFNFNPQHFKPSACQSIDNWWGTESVNSARIIVDVISLVGQRWSTALNSNTGPAASSCLYPPPPSYNLALMTTQTVEEKKKTYALQLAAHTLRQWNALCDAIERRNGSSTTSKPTRPYDSEKGDEDTGDRTPKGNHTNGSHRGVISRL